MRPVIYQRLNEGLQAIRTPGAIRNGIVLAGASGMSMIFGLVASKIWAIAVGPGGLGRASAFQALVTLVATVVGLGLGSAIVKHGAEPASARDTSQFRLLVRAAWSLWLCAALIGVVALLLGRIVYRLHRESISLTADDLFLIWALTATTASSLAMGVISASRRVGFQAMRLAVGALVGHSLSVPLVLWGGQSVIELAIALNYSGILLVSLILYRRVVIKYPLPRLSNMNGDLKLQRTTLFQTGLFLAFSNLAGGGVQSALPLLVVFQAGDAAAGLLRASSLLAFQSVGFLMIGLSHDYFPRLSAVRQDTGAILDILRQQARLILVLASLLSCLLTALGPWLLNLCFSEEFASATRLLDLLAVGMILKMGSWCLAYIVLVRCSSKLYLMTEGITGLFWLLSAYALIRFCGIDGVGYSFVLTYLIYAVAVSAIVSKETQSYLPWKILLVTVTATLPAIGCILLRTALGAIR